MQKYVAFLKVIEMGSFTKAAELLGYTQPALSQMIAALEKELSVKLLYRSRYGIQLTPEGERLFPSIQNSVLQYSSMRRLADEIKGIETGVIRIGTVSSVSCHWLPGIIKQFWSEHPNVQLVLHQGDYSSICEWVRTGAIDFGFVNPKAVKGLETHIIKSGKFLAVFPVGHPLAEKETVSLQDLADEPYLLLEEGAYSEPLDAFQTAGIKPNIRLTIHDDYSIMSMVEQGLGYSILAELVLHRTDYHIVARSVVPPIVRTLALVMKDKNSLPIAAKAFMKYLMQNDDILL